MILPLVSIITPIYNAKDYLLNLFNAIINQTYDSYEWIIIDDGSNDGSESLCDTLPIKDNRIRVIHIINNGVSNARNLGIENAYGDYITFVDSDDYIEVDYLERLINHVDKDIVVCQKFIVRDNKVIAPDLSISPYAIYNKPIAFSYLYLKYDMFSPYNKLFKRNIILENGVTFPLELSYGEDSVFVANYMKFASSMICLSYCGYYYNKTNNNSLSSNIRVGLIDEMIKSRDLCLCNLLEVCDKKDVIKLQTVFNEEKIMSTALIYTKVFYSQRYKYKERIQLLKSIKCSPYYCDTLINKQKYYQGIMLKIIVINNVHIQYFLFKIIRIFKYLLGN